jgi:MYXO-CTERM domain-containing protein
MLNPARPSDWKSPIDYRNGVVHVRAEIIDKPAGSANTRWTLCYIPNRGIGSGYGCANTAAYTEKGIFDIDTGMTTWWQNDMIDWTQGIKQMDLVLKDSMGKFAHTLPAELFFPTTVRITMVQVSKGATYDPSKVPNLPPAMTSDGGAADGGAGDGAVSADSGGSASGGTTGTGGSGGAAGGDGSGGAAGTPGGSGTGGTTGTGAGGSAGSTTSGTGGSGPGSGAVSGGGCAIPTDGSQSGLTGILIVGLVMLFVRRRRRA